MHVTQDAEPHTRRSLFDLSVSGRPGGSEEAGGQKKTKTGKQGPGGGPGAPRALRPSAKVGWERGGPRGRWAGRVVDGPGRSGRSMGRSGWLGLVVLLLGCQNAWKFACFEVFRPQNRACGALFLFSKQGARAL